VAIVFLGGEIPSNRILLIESGVKHVGVNFWGLSKRGLPKTKDYLLSERYPEDVKIYVDGGSSKADQANLSSREMEDYVAGFEDWVAINYDRIEAVVEFDSSVLGSDWIDKQRSTLGWELGSKYWPVWHPRHGHASLFALSEAWDNVAMSGDTLEEDTSLAGRTRALQSQFGTSYHALACAKPDNLRQVPVDTASTLSWLSPMMRGETIVWDGTKLVRYQKKMKDQARPRYKAVIERAGLDFDKIMNDDNNEVTRLAIWSYLQLEESLDKKNRHLKVIKDEKLSDNSEHIDDPGSAETMGVDPDNSALEVRKLSDVERPKVTPRDPSERTNLPVFSISTKTVVDKDEMGRDLIRDVNVLESTQSSLRQCNTCFVAANCPAFKPDNACAFNLPIEVKTKDQLKGLLNAIIEMQGARVAFSRFAEELNGGYPDPNTGQEIDRLFKIVKQLKELEENKEFVRMTVERQTSGGVLSALFGDRASTLRDLPNGGLSEEETSRIISDNID
jgi:hypothetical protein